VVKGRGRVCVWGYDGEFVDGKRLLGGLPLVRMLDFKAS